MSDTFFFLSMEEISKCKECKYCIQEKCILINQAVDINSKSEKCPVTDGLKNKIVRRHR